MASVRTTRCLQDSSGLRKIDRSSGTCHIAHPAAPSATCARGYVRSGGKFFLSLLALQDKQSVHCSVAQSLTCWGRCCQPGRKRPTCNMTRPAETQGMRTQRPEGSIMPEVAMETGLGLGFLTVEGPFAGQLQEPHQAAPVGGCLDKRAEGCTMLHPSCARHRK